MKRYALKFDPESGGDIVDMVERDNGRYCLAPDVSELERRYREAVGLLRSEPMHSQDDKWCAWDNKRIAFLAGEPQ